MKKVEIIPAILVKSRIELFSRLKSVSELAKTVQIDIMDGKFVNNKTISVKSFRGIVKKLNYQIHLMVKKPENYVVPFKKIKSDLIIFHIESLKDKKEALLVIKKIKKNKMKVGIALNPKTDAIKIKPLLSYIDLVLVMTVTPGYSGQKFKKSELNKIKKIRRWSKKIDIEVDGGVNEDNAKDCIKAGANKLVMLSALFVGKDTESALEEIKSKMSKRL